MLPTKLISNGRSLSRKLLNINIGLNGCPCITSERSIHYRKFGEKLKENAQRNPRNMEDVEKLGLKQHLKKNRIYSQYNYQEWRYPQKERAIDISCSRLVFQEYEDKEGFATRIRQPRKEFKDMRTERYSHRQIKKKVPSFHRKRFPAEAQDIYVKAHDLLNTENWIIAKKEETEEALHGLVTEFAYPKMIEGLEYKTVNWKFIESIEPARSVQVLVMPMINLNNLYGQVTVRFHTRQILTIHDRFGRLMMGSPDIPRDILEYVTFERHVSNPYGKWRIHSKKVVGNRNSEEQKKTVAILKRKPIRSESEEWQKNELETHYFKWYPQREEILHKRKTTYGKYLSDERRLKRHMYSIAFIKRAKLLRMKRKYLRVVSKKSLKVYEMRQRGELPLPPS